MQTMQTNHKTYVFRTPSNQKIDVDSSIYSLFREIITVEDLKFLFTSKERLYSMDFFELAFFNKDTKQTEILNHDTKLCDLQINEYLVIHVTKKTVGPDFVNETIDEVDTLVETIVEKAVDTIVDQKDETEKAVVTVVEKTIADTAIEAVVDPVVEKVEKVSNEKDAEKANAVVEKVEKVIETIVGEEVSNEKDVEKANAVAIKVDDEEKVVEKKFCLIC